MKLQLTTPRLRWPILLLGALGGLSTGVGGLGQDCGENAGLNVGDGAGRPGEVVAVELRGSSQCLVAGFSLAVGHDTTRVELAGASAGQFLLDHAGSELVFGVFPHNSEGFAALFVAFDLRFPLTVPPRDVPPDTLLATLTYRVLPGALPGAAALRNEDRTFGSPNPISNVYIEEDGTEIHPRLGSGAIVVLEPTGGFLRADANADGAQDLSDVVFLLLYLFRRGTATAPPCLSAADSNDDGRVNLLDPVTLIAVLFRGAGPIPPPSGACGPDPTPDALTCEAYGACP
ncbi:MAG: hypothetical protein HY721_32905 [Planctomycetes bacterium]|nr:hypothetical protein [Planctomycetota bacterium]